MLDRDHKRDALGIAGDSRPRGIQAQRQADGSNANVRALKQNYSALDSRRHGPPAFPDKEVERVRSDR
jgi:hypothetical protein